MIVVGIILLIALACSLWSIKTLKDRLKETSKSEKMQKAFLTNIHHEICVPLKAVKSLGRSGRERRLVSFQKRETQHFRPVKL